MIMMLWVSVFGGIMNSMKMCIRDSDKIVVLDADLSNATMTNRFSAVYPARFFDFGIAEANMACAAAGFAHEGLILSLIHI